MLMRSKAVSGHLSGQRASSLFALRNRRNDERLEMLKGSDNWRGEKIGLRATGAYATGEGVEQIRSGGVTRNTNQHFLQSLSDLRLHKYPLQLACSYRRDFSSSLLGQFASYRLECLPVGKRILYPPVRVSFFS